MISIPSKFCELHNITGEDGEYIEIVVSAIIKEDFKRTEINNIIVKGNQN